MSGYRRRRGQPLRARHHVREGTPTPCSSAPGTSVPLSPSSCP
jgi:hypothetical protein